MNKRLTTDEALVRMEMLCARSEMCSYEVEQKLRRQGFTQGESEKIIDSLTDRKFIDDRRFAAAFTRDKYRFARWGRNKIRSHLILKRIPHQAIDEAMQSIDLREYARTAYAVIAARLRSLPSEMPQFEQRQRLLRFAAGRGYETSLIIRILDSEKLWDSRKE